ncbi:hypothetical protein AMTRI_Chr09g43170 [Amborella trichopoda]|uniref:At3g05675-like ankyrin-like domain-containing protein n=1 Tax=Amborella trichopoda TaxID=13333 RepID=U5D9X0_AMBTC|nr:BTB/POZ domain-containing protein At3g05675 [Amborella trichopoda]XP_020531445.1 BTB/POZ domain-containing protein At3g05675 [Amborella trichopoda]XP_020531446.1 BTB/POZ domain-containing protein At3g05675 [Amborella trichopoda]XP_020531447.1 BTB/POZ domain-containing protein At3g05675 [Amborella trichopoda]ERN19299.1 hypothetical protein AMTR_s00069p00039370 [Amborella trichopoda]|eukprot:XP_006857832.1 BTB/POZ domain-containing protein At3g05675 [Amborella trichopoda]
MAKAEERAKCKLGDRATSDVIVRLRTREGTDTWFYCHSHILIQKSQFFADKLSNKCPTHRLLDSRNWVEVYYSLPDHSDYVNLLKLLYLPDELVPVTWNCVKSALGSFRAAIALGCKGISQHCVNYLEAIPWESYEEEEILQALPILGVAAMPILARLEPVDPTAVKNVFLSAIHFATSTNKMCDSFPDDLKASAQEQVEYMLVEDEDAPLVIADNNVKCEVRECVIKLFSVFKAQLALLLSEPEGSIEGVEKQVLETLSDLEWICYILPKMELMKEFVHNWDAITDNVLGVVQDKKFASTMWGVKSKLVEVTGKVLEAVGYGNVVSPPPIRVHLLKAWLPYIRKMKSLLDLQCGHEKGPFKMDPDLCQSIEAAIVSLVLALPSSDQGEILADWLEDEQVRFPDLSEAFEVWCYRTKAAKRRLVVGVDGVANSTISH